MKNKRAFSVVEYAVLFVIVMSAFFIMRNYIQRGIFGMWAKSGQGFAYGRQYDAQRTIECSFDEESNLWYDRNCFLAAYNQTCPVGGDDCAEGIITGTCQTNSCNQGAAFSQ